MEALELLLNRRSQPRLSEPMPTGNSLENILQAAVCVPDHKCLSPWRFIVCTGEGLVKLGDIFEQATIAVGKGQESIERAPKLPLRAPMVVIAVCNYIEDEKVPRVEQIASTACSVQAMQMAAVAQGFQGIWRTGWYAQDDFVKQSLGCKHDDEILGFLYLGSSVLKSTSRKPRDLTDLVSYWK